MNEAPAQTEGNEPTVPTHLTVKINGEPRELNMSFNLQRRIVKLVDVTKLDRLQIDPNLSDPVIEECIQKRDKRGKPEVFEKLDDIDIAPQDADTVLQWATGHIVDFFVKRLEAAKGTNAQFEPILKRLMHSPNGSEG